MKTNGSPLPTNDFHNVTRRRQQPVVGDGSVSKSWKNEDEKIKNEKIPLHLTHERGQSEYQTLQKFKHSVIVGFTAGPLVVCEDVPFDQIKASSNENEWFAASYKRFS